MGRAVGSIGSAGGRSSGRVGGVGLGAEEDGGVTSTGGGAAEVSGEGAGAMASAGTVAGSVGSGVGLGGGVSLQAASVSRADAESSSGRAFIGAPQ